MTTKPTECPHCGAEKHKQPSLSGEFFVCGSVKFNGEEPLLTEACGYAATLRQQLAEVTGERDGARLNLKGPCELCWTCSWAPCPPGTPHAVKDGENWIVCQCCEMKKQLADCRNQLVTAEAVEAGLRADVADLQQQLVDEKAKREVVEKEINYAKEFLKDCACGAETIMGGIQMLRRFGNQYANDLRTRLETAEAERDQAIKTRNEIELKAADALVHASTLTSLLRRAKEFMIRAANEDCGPSCETKECRHDRAKETLTEITAALEGKPAGRDAEALLKEAEGVLEAFAKFSGELEKRFGRAHDMAGLGLNYLDLPDHLFPTIDDCRAAATLLAKIREGK